MKTPELFSGTGHKNTNMPDGKTLVEWIKPVMSTEIMQMYPSVEMPTDKQIALVISALRMHTIIVHAAQYDFSELGYPNKKTEYWPTEISIGRYFRDAAREVLDE